MNTREKPNIFIRSICIALSAILFVTNVVGAQAQKPSDDFWAERQKTVKAAREYAQLPDNPSVSPFIKGRDRGIIPDITGIEAKAKQQSPGNIPNLIVKNGPSWLRSLPYAYATLEDYYESPRKDSPTVIFVQDVHGHYEAQLNIANIINNIAEAQGTEVRRPKSEDRNLKTNGRYRSSVIGPRSSVVVGLEGAVGAFDFSPYRAFPNKEINKEIADYFLKSGLISGPEYVGLVSDIEPMFWGVEDKDTYLANIEAFKESLPLRDNAKKQIETAARRLVDLKRKVYSPEMLSLDEKIEGYHNGTLGLGEYLGYLSSIPSFSKGGLGRIMNNPPNVNLFLEVFKTEKTLDFNKVEDERRILIEKLVNVLEKEELESLVYQAVAHRMGNLDNSAYYHELENVCQKHGLRLSNWPELARYVRYSIGADKIDRRALFGEINRLEEDVVAQFTGGEAQEAKHSRPLGLSSFRIGRHSTTPDESGNYTTAAMEVYETSKYISLVSKLIDNNLTDEEWKEYEKLGARDLGLGTSNNTPKKLASSPQPLVPVVKSFEKFYEVATSRNKILIENLLTKIGEPKTDGRKPKSDFGLQTSVFGLAVLVAGGFHTQAIAKLLKEKRISYAILSPKLTEIDPTKGAQYLEAFAQNRTPLDKLMLGEKIFLSAFRSMGQVPGNGIVQEFEPNIAMRSNFHGALEAGLNLDELLSQTKASKSETNKIISGLQKLIENKLPFIKTIRFLDYAKTRDGGTVLPMLINGGEGFTVEIHPKRWVPRKVTVAGVVDGKLTQRSFRIRSLKLGERLSFQIPPLLPKTIKTATAWALFPIVPKETLEMAIKSIISFAMEFYGGELIKKLASKRGGSHHDSTASILGRKFWKQAPVLEQAFGLPLLIMAARPILKKTAQFLVKLGLADAWVYVFARPATRGVRPLSTEEALPDSNIMDAPEKRNRKLESNEPGGFFKPVTIFALLGLMTAGGLIGTIFYSQASFVNELFTGLDIVSSHWQGMLAYLGLGIAFPFVGAMARRGTGEKPNMRKKKEGLRDKSLREGERIFLLDFAERYSQHLPKANYEIFFKSEPYDVELEENPVAAMVNMRLTSQHHTKRIQEALLKEVRRLAGLPRPSNAKLTPENIITDFLVLKYWFGINNKQFAGIYGVARQRISLVEPRTFRMLWPVLKEVFRSVNEHGHMPAPLIEYVGLLSEKGLGALESLMRADTVFRDRVLDDLLEDGQLIENLPERQRQAAQRLLATMQQLNSGTNIVTPLEWATEDEWSTQFMGYTAFRLQAKNVYDEPNITEQIKQELIRRASDPANTTYYGSIKAYKWPIGQDEITYYMLVDPTFRNPKSETEKFRNRLEKVLASVPESVQREFLSQFKEDVNPLVRAHLSSARYAAIDPLPNGFVGIRQEVFTDNGTMLRSWLNEIAASLPEVVRRRINLLEVEQLREVFLEIADTHELRHELLISERAVLADLNFLTEPDASYKEVVDKLEESKVIMTAFGMRSVEYMQQRQDAEELRNTYIGAIDAQEANRRLWSLKAMSSRKPYRLSQEWINAAIYLLTQETPTPEQLTNLRKDIETPAVDISRDESLDILESKLKPAYMRLGFEPGFTETIVLEAKKPSVIEPQEPNPTALKVLFWGYMETAWRLFQNPPGGFEQRELYDRTFGWMMVSFHAMERLSERPEFSDIQLVEEQKAIEIINDIQYSILPIAGRTHQLRPERFPIAFRHGPANVKRLIEYLTSRSSYDLPADQLPAALSTILTYLEEGFEIETPATQSFIRDFLAHLEEKVNKLEPPLPQKILERLSALRKRLQSPEQGKPASILGRKFWKQAPVLEQAFGLPLLIMAARSILKRTAQFLVKLGLADESLLEAAKNLKKTDKGSLRIGAAGSLALISWLAAAMVYGVWWLWPLGVGIWMASAGYVFQRAHDRYAELVRGTRGWNTFYVNKGDRMITQFFNRDRGGLSRGDKFRLFLVGGALAGATVAPALLFFSGATLPFLSPVSQLSILQVSFITPALLFAGLLANIVLHFIYNALVVSGILEHWPVASIPRKMLIQQLSSENNKVRQTAITEIYKIYYPTIERHAVRAYHMFRYISEEIAGVPFTNLSPEDFISEAKISMYGSIKKFNAARYSPYLVESYIFRYVDRDLAQMMSRVWDIGIYQAGEIVRILNKSVRFPSEQYREYLKLTKEQVVQQMSALDAQHQLESIIKQIQAQYQPSLESRHGLVREENLMAVKDTRLKPEEKIYADERYDIIMTAIDGLDKPKQKKAKRALRLRFGLEDGTEWNNQEIADKFSLSRESIRLYIDTALKRLRLPSRKLMELIYNPVQDIREEVSVFQSLATNPLPVSSSFEPNKGQLRAASRSADYLTETEKDELWRWVNMELPLFQKQILPYVLQGMSNKKMAGLMRVKVDNVSKAKELLLRDLRIWFTLGIFDQYGTYEHIRKFLIKLAREPGKLNSNNRKDKTTGKTRAASKNKRLIFNVVLWLILPAFAVIAQWLGFHMSSVGQIQQSGFMVWSGWQEIFKFWLGITDMETLLSALAAAGLSSFIWYVAWGIPLAFAAITSPPDKPEKSGKIEEWLEWLSKGTREEELKAISEIQVLLSTNLLFQRAASEITARDKTLVNKLSNLLPSQGPEVREAAMNLLAYMTENEIIVETIAAETSTLVHHMDEFHNLMTEPAQRLLQSILPDVEVRKALEEYKLTDPKKLADVVKKAYFKVTGKSERRAKAQRIALMSLLEFVSPSTAQRLKRADMKDVYINKTLENVLGASGKFQAAGATLNKVLDDLSLQFPYINLKDEITEGGRIAVLIKRGENIIDVVIPKGLETPLQTGDKIYLIAKVGGGAAEQGEKKTGINGQDLQLAMRLATMGLGHSEITELKTQLRKEAEQVIKNLEIQDKKIEQNILEKYIPDIYLILLVQRAINRVDIVNPGHVAHEALVAQPDKMLVSLFEKFVQTLKTEPRKARPALLRLEAVTELHFKALKKWLVEDVSLEDARINAKRFVEKEVKQLLKSVNAENWEYVEVPWSLNVEFKKGLPVSRVTFVLSEGYSLSSFTKQFRSRLKNYPSASIEERANTLKALGSQIEQGKIEPEHNLLVTFRIPTEDDRELFASMLGESETHTKLAAKWIVTEEEWRQLEKTANQYESLKKQIANEISLLENQLRATELSEELFRINTRLQELNNDSEFSAHWQMELEAMSGRLTAIHAVVSNFGDNALRKLFLQTNKLVIGLQHKYQEHLYREALARAEHAFTSHVEWLWNHASIVELRSLGDKPNFRAMLSELKFIDKHDALLQSLSNLRTILLKNKQYDFRLEHFYERLKYLHNMVIEINSYFLEFKNIDRPRADQFYYAAVIGIAREFIAMTLVWAISMGTYENIFSAKYARNRILKSFQYNPVASVSSVPVIGESADEPLKRLSELITNEQMLIASKPESKDSLLSHVFFDLYTALLADLAVIREELAGVLAKHVLQHRLVVLLIKILYHLRVVLDLAVKADKLNRTMYEQISSPARALASMLGLNENDIDELYSFDILQISALLNQPDIVFKKISPKIKGLVEAESVLDENDVAPGTQVTLSLVLERRGLLDIVSEKGTIIKVNGQIVADSANTMVSAGDTITMILIMPAGGAAGRVLLMAPFLLFGLLSIAALIDTDMLTFALNILPAWDMQTFPVAGFSLLVLAAVIGAFLAKLPANTKPAAGLQSLENLLLPVSKTKVDYAADPSGPAIRLNLKKRAVGAGVTALLVGSIVLNAGAWERKMPSHLKSPETFGLAAPYMSAAEMPKGKELEKIVKHAGIYLKQLEEELAAMNKTDKGSDRDIWLTGFSHGVNAAQASNEKGQKALAKLSRRQAGELRSKFNARPGSLEDVTRKTGIYEDALQRGQWYYMASRLGMVGKISDLRKKAVAEIRGLFYDVVDVTELLETGGRKGYAPVITQLKDYRNMNKAGLVLVTRSNIGSKNEIISQVREALAGSVKPQEKELLDLLNNKEVKMVFDTNKLRKDDVLVRENIDGTVRDRVNTEKFVLALTNISRITGGAGVRGIRIVAASPYSWTPYDMDNLTYTELKQIAVQILLYVTDGLVIDATKQMNEVYRLYEGRKKLIDIGA